MSHGRTCGQRPFDRTRLGGGGRRGSPGRGRRRSALESVGQVPAASELVDSHLRLAWRSRGTVRSGELHMPDQYFQGTPGAADPTPAPPSRRAERLPGSPRLRRGGRSPGTRIPRSERTSPPRRARRVQTAVRTGSDRLTEAAPVTLSRDRRPQARGLGPGPHLAGQGSLQGDAVACPAGDAELASTSLRPAPMTARRPGCCPSPRPRRLGELLTRGDACATCTRTTPRRRGRSGLGRTAGSRPRWSSEPHRRDHGAAARPQLGAVRESTIPRGARRCSPVVVELVFPAAVVEAVHGSLSSITVRSRGFDKCQRCPSRCIRSG